MKYINKLSKEQEKELLSIIGFKVFNTDGFKFERYIEGENVVYRCYGSYLNFEDEYLYISDFNVYHNDQTHVIFFDEEDLDRHDTKKLHKFMSKIFGKEYVTELVEKLNKDKQKLFESKEKYKDNAKMCDSNDWYVKKELMHIDAELKELEK